MLCRTCNRDFGPGVFCYSCFRYLPTSTVGIRATTARRGQALFIDVCAFLLFLATISWASRFIKTPAPSDLHMVAVIAVAALLYLAAFVRGLSNGQTLGKLALGLKVVDRQTGQVPSIWRMLLRETFGKLASALAFGMGFLAARDNPDGQAWHDRYADTVVAAPAEDLIPFAANQHDQPLWPVVPLAALLLLVVSGLLAPRLGEPPVQAQIAPPAKPRQAAAQLAINAVPPIRYSGITAKPSAMELPETTTVLPPPSTIAPLPPALSSAPLRPVLSAPPAPSLSKPTPAPVYAHNQQPTQAPADPAREIQHFLANWSTAQANEGAQQVGRFYAPDVQRYFLRRNVSRGYVIADHQAFLDRGRRARFFTVTDLKYERLSTDTAALDLVKSWNEMSPDQTSSTRRSTRSRLWLQKYPDGWKITGEQDLKTP